MLTWINAKYAGSCWLCRASIMQGDKVAYAYTAPRACVGPQGQRLISRPHIICRPCGNTYAARMAEAEESRRAAVGHALATAERGE